MTINLVVCHLNVYVVRERKQCDRIDKRVVFSNVALSVVPWQRHLKINNSLLFIMSTRRVFLDFTAYVGDFNQYITYIFILSKQNQRVICLFLVK